MDNEASSLTVLAKLAILGRTATNVTIHIGEFLKIVVVRVVHVIVILMAVKLYVVKNRPELAVANPVLLEKSVPNVQVLEKLYKTAYAFVSFRNHF
mgnify:FL=1